MQACAESCEAEPTCAYIAWYASNKNKVTSCKRYVTAVNGCKDGSGVPQWDETPLLLPRRWYKYHRQVADRPTHDNCPESEATDWGTNNKDYRGCQHRTRTGASCVPWNTLSFTGHAAEKITADDTDGTHAYCRNPDNGGRRKTIYCYTKADDDSKWEYCDPIDIPSWNGLSPEACSAIKQRGFNQYVTLAVRKTNGA